MTTPTTGVAHHDVAGFRTGPVHRLWDGTHPVWRVHRVRYYTACGYLIGAGLPVPLDTPGIRLCRACYPDPQENP